MRIDPVLASQRYRVTLQLLDAEQFGAQQLRIPLVTRCIQCACQKSELFDDYGILLARTWDRTWDNGSEPAFMICICRKRIP
jgi:hypothetical protein